MTNNEIKFLEYLDKSVEWEKEKQIALKTATKPFNKTEILKIIEDFEIKKIKTINDCVERMKMIKVSNNAFVRREFLSIIREDFNNIDFQKLATNVGFIKIKNDILKNNPDLTFVDDNRFLHQIGNAFAHGNYNSLLDMEKLNSLWTGDGSREVEFKKSDNLNVYINYVPEIFQDNPELNSEANLIRRKVHSALNQPQKVSDLRLYLHILNNTTDSDSLIEKLSFKYESNRMLDANGNVVMRPATKVFDLEINHRQLKELIVILISLKQFTGNIQMQLKPNSTNTSALPDEISDEDVAKLILSSNDFSLNDVVNGNSEPLSFDNKQEAIFINEYVNSRQWFTKDFFDMIEGERSKDLIATNQFSQLLVLNNFFFKNYLNIASADTSIESTENLFNVAFYNLVMGQAKGYDEILADLSKYVHDLKFVFNSYTEALVNEIVLILQLIEDNQLFSTCESNQGIVEIVNNLDKNETQKFSASPKYKNDVHSVLYHLRDSFTHLLYLNNLNTELFIYDYASKRNKTPDFKFTISIENLEKLRNELLTIVKTYVNQQTAAKSAQISTNTQVETENSID